VVESPAAPGDATADDSDDDDPLELDPALPPLPPLPPELRTRTVPFMFGWIVQM
jgi:hypothetical protein